MCTAVTYQSRSHYFGRNLDLEYSYEESVTITPRHFPLSFRAADTLHHHHAIVGIAYVADGYPLYYDAMNEKGLGIAGLHFPESTVYQPPAVDRVNIAPYELIPWLLGQCASISEARSMLAEINMTAHDFRADLPCTPLHWFLADRTGSAVLEALADGLHIYEDPVGVLTNEPAFPYHLMALRRYAALHPGDAEPVDGSHPYSRGMGAFGLPGDFTSVSRFIKAAFVRANSISGDTETESVHQIFHILGSVAMPRGSVRISDKNEITVYSSCADLEHGIYYYTAYENSAIQAVDLHREDLDGDHLVSYPLLKQATLHLQNL